MSEWKSLKGLNQCPAAIDPKSEFAVSRPWDRPYFKNTIFIKFPLLDFYCLKLKLAAGGDGLLREKRCFCS